MSEPVAAPVAPTDSFWLSPRGEMIRVDASQAPTIAKLPGFQLAPPEMVHKYFLEQEYGGTGQALLSGAEGFGRALTFGLSSPLERALGVSQEGMAARQQLHGLAGDVGFGFGTLAALAGGPEALAGKAAAEGAGLGLGELTAPALIAKAGDAVKGAVTKGLAPTTTLGKLGTGALAGAAGMGAEGALYGLGDAIHQTTIADPDLSAEALLANAGKTVLESAGLAGALGAGGGLLSSATGLLRPKIAPWLRKAEEDVYAGKLRVSDPEQRELMRDMADRNLVGPFVKPETTNLRAEEFLRNTGKKMESFIADADMRLEEAPKNRADGGRLLKELRDIAGKLGSDDLKVNPARQLLEYADRLEKRWAGESPDMRRTAGQLWQLRENLDEMLRGPKGLLDPDGTWYRKGLHDFRWAVARELADTVDRTGLASREWKSLNRDYHVASEAQQLSEAAVQHQLRTSKFSLTEKGAAIAGLVHGTPEGMALAGAYVAAHKYGPDVEAMLLRGLSGAGEKAGAVSTIASQTERMVGKIRDAAKGMVSNKITPHLAAPAAAIIVDNINRVQQLSADAERVYGWVDGHTSDLSEHAPDTALSAQAAMSRALLYLAQTAPQGRQPAGLRPAIPPSKTELAQWHQRYETVQDPIGVMSKGVMSKEVLDTLKTVYPKLYGQVREQLLEEVTKDPTIPYQRGLQISRLLGMPLYDSQSPRAIQTNLASTPPPAPPVPPPLPSSRSSRASGAGSRMAVPLTALGSLYKTH